MIQNANGEKMITGIDCLEVYSVNKAAQLFICLSTENQDELFGVMRETKKRSQEVKAQIELESLKIISA